MLRDKNFNRPQINQTYYKRVNQSPVTLQPTSRSNESLLERDHKTQNTCVLSTEREISTRGRIELKLKPILSRHFSKTG